MQTSASCLPVLRTDELAHDVTLTTEIDTEWERSIYNLMSHPHLSKMDHDGSIELHNYRLPLRTDWAMSMIDEIV